MTRAPNWFQYSSPALSVQVQTANSFSLFFTVSASPSLADPLFYVIPLYKFLPQLSVSPSRVQFLSFCSSDWYILMTSKHPHTRSSSIVFISQQGHNLLIAPPRVQPSWFKCSYFFNSFSPGASVSIHHLLIGQAYVDIALPRIKVISSSSTSIPTMILYSVSSQYAQTQGLKS